MRRLDDAVVRGLWERHRQGESLEALGRERSCTSGAIRNLFRSRGLPLPQERRVCALGGCDQVFEVTATSEQVYCSRAHAKKGSSRRRVGAGAVRVSCALPECSKDVLATYRAGERPRLFEGRFVGTRFCCKDHAELHRRRVEEGWYDRLLGLSGEYCAVCGDELMSEAHPVLGDPAPVLCTNHYAMIHRGLAEWRDGQYVDLTAEIEADTLCKEQLYEGYLDGGGNTDGRGASG